MTFAEAIVPLVLFVIVAVGTPGPNNAMLLASGANFGIRRSLPHLLGVNLGFALMVLVVALGLGATLLQHPAFAIALKIVGAIYLLYLAFRIATSDTMKQTEVKRQPITFVEAALFQWVNPKAWVMASGASVTYALAGFSPLANAAVLGAVFLVAGSPFSSAWLFGGAWLSRFLSSPRRRVVFNVMMGLLLALSLIPVLADLV